MSKAIENILFDDLAQIIEQGKEQLVAQVNSTITLVYWHVGYKINTHILENKRAEYGKEIVSIISKQLVEKYGKSFELRNLRRMMQFAQEFPDVEKVSLLATQLSWSHFIELLPLQRGEAKYFYAIKASEATWSRNELRNQIERKAFERNEIANCR
jgi:hypothetical protein